MRIKFKFKFNNLKVYILNEKKTTKTDKILQNHKEKPKKKNR